MMDDTVTDQRPSTFDAGVPLIAYFLACLIYLLRYKFIASKKESDRHQDSLIKFHLSRVVTG
jgi:hypothetical protein